jgi:hypothetical protein
MLLDCEVRESAGSLALPILASNSSFLRHKRHLLPRGQSGRHADRTPPYRWHLMIQSAFAPTRVTSASENCQRPYPGIENTEVTFCMIPYAFPGSLLYTSPHYRSNSATPELSQTWMTISQSTIPLEPSQRLAITRQNARTRDGDHRVGGLQTDPLSIPADGLWISPRKSRVMVGLRLYRSF